MKFSVFIGGFAIFDLMSIMLSIVGLCQNLAVLNKILKVIIYIVS